MILQVSADKLKKYSLSNSTIFLPNLKYMSVFIILGSELSN